MFSRKHGTLYAGVTADLARRVWEHQNGVGSTFVRRYGLYRRVYYERHEDIRTAIHREKAIKTWLRAWKVRFIQRNNPEWDDLPHELM
jgi:putative endonuclease